MLSLVELSQAETQKTTQPDLLTQLLTVGKEAITKMPIVYQKGKYIYERTPEGKIIIRPATQITSEIPTAQLIQPVKHAGMFGGISPVLLLGIAAAVILFLALRKS